MSDQTSAVTEAAPASTPQSCKGGEGCACGPNCNCGDACACADGAPC